MGTIQLDQSFMIKNTSWLSPQFKNPYDGESFILIGLYGRPVGNEYRMSLTNSVGMDMLPPGIEIYGDDDGQLQGVTTIHIPLVSSFFKDQFERIENLISQIMYHQKQIYILKDTKDPTRTVQGTLREIMNYISNNVHYLKQKHEMLRNPIQKTNDSSASITPTRRFSSYGGDMSPDAYWQQMAEFETFGYLPYDDIDDE